MKTQVYVKLSTTNDNNGNPRRLYIVKQIDATKPENGAERLAIIVESYNGNQEVRHRFPQACHLLEITITPAEFKQWLKVKKTDDGYKREEVGTHLDTHFKNNEMLPKKKTRENIITLGVKLLDANSPQESASIAFQRYVNSPLSFQ